MKLDSNLAIVDVETTGGIAAFHKIIEIAVLRIDGGRLQETYSTLVNPERTVPFFIERLTGITDAELRQAPTFGDIKDTLRGILDGHTFVAHNARFDYGFVKEEFERENVNWSAKCLCTMRLSRTLFPQFNRHGVDSLLERHGISCTQRHRALGDALVLWDFLRLVNNEFTDPQIEAALSRIMKTATLPPGLDDAVIDGLPEAPGVYIFRGEKGIPLYVGKGVNVRKRVLSHLTRSADSMKASALSRRVVGIEAIRTSGELGALLLESQLIKELHPMYNRAWRSRKKLVAITRAQQSSGYDSIRISALNGQLPSELNQVLGIFSSSKAATRFLWDTAKEHHLCPKVLGLENGGGVCSYYQLRRCQGACTGQESPVSFNLRFLEAFRTRKIRPWPFQGPVLVKEKTPWHNEGEAFIIDNWCLLAAFRFDDFGTRKTLHRDYVFDYDAYKVMAQHLLQRGKNFALKELTEAELKGILE
jgi:DNA polymerase III subunit epsilon